MVTGPELLEQLNQPQRKAVELCEGPLLIVAGAGSGKTRTITCKIAFLIHEHGVNPDNILAVTFTNKAAQEMRERVEALVGDLPGPPLISTFHSFSARLLRRHAHLLGFGNDYSICDVQDQRRVYGAVYQELGVDREQLPIRMVQAVVSRAKNKGQSWQGFVKVNSDTPNSELIGSVFEAYQAYLRDSNAMDFDDLMLNGVRLLVEEEELGRHYAEKFRYVLIDEYQDTNRPQNELLRALTRTHQNVTAVGDEDQSIYSFRGADISNILRFEQDFPGAQVIKLEQNYRSTQVILDAASAVISRNAKRRPKKLWTESQGGDLVSLFIAGDARIEARFVARRVFNLLRESDDEIGVLYRTNFQSRILEEELRRLYIPYRLVGGESFYNRKEVKDALAYLRLVCSPVDNIALLRIINEPSRGIGRVTLERLQGIAQEKNLNLWEAVRTGLDSRLLPGRSHIAVQSFQRLIEDCQSELSSPLHLCLERILERVGYRDHLSEIGTEESASRLLNLDELVTVARDCYQRGEGIQEFLDNAALYSETDEYDSASPVTLMTLHNAKGLEFQCVLLVGCEEGLFPHSLSTTEEELEEERRLCYVGITRARKRLYLSYSRTRRLYGQDLPGFNKPSRFLEEIPSELVQLEAGSTPAYQVPSASGSGAGYRRRSPYQGKTYNSPAAMKQALSTAGRPSGHPALQLTSGDQVEHRRYGPGRVLQVENTGKDLKVTVRFPGIGIKKLLQSYARLELI